MSEIIRARVQGPAIALMVTAGLSILVRVMNLVLTMVGVIDTAAFGGGAAQGAVSGVYGFIGAAVGALAGGFIIFGAMKMRELQSHGLCVAAGIVALVPCISPCCFLTLPVGVWALVVLMKPEVKQAFSS